MDSRLSPLACLIKDTARRFAAERLRNRVSERSVGDAWTKLTQSYCDLGLNLVDLPRDLGGAGLGALVSCLTHEALASGDVNHAFALPQPGAFASMVGRLGSEQQRHRWLADFATQPMTTQGAVAIGPPHALRAEPHGDGWRLSGSLPAVWHLPRADRLVVVADHKEKPEAQVALVMPWQPTPQGAVALEGLSLAQMGALSLDDVQVPEAQCLKQGDLRAALSGVFAQEAMRMASYALGTARAASSYVLSFAEERRQSGHPLAHFQSMGFLLIDIELACREALGRLQMAAEASEMALARQMAPDWDIEPLDEDLQEAIEVARSKADEVAFFVTDSALQILDDGHEDGAHHPISAWHKDVKLLSQCYRMQAWLQRQTAFDPAVDQEQETLLC